MSTCVCLCMYTLAHRQYCMHAFRYRCLQGLQTVVVTDHEPNGDHYKGGADSESHHFYPNDDHASRRTFQTSDTRGALAPFIAFKALQANGSKFKWLFTGMADTMFFIEGARRAVQGLDWDKPYILTGRCSTCLTVQIQAQHHSNW